MRDPFDSNPPLVNSSHQSSCDFTQQATMAMQASSGFGNGDAGFWTPTSDSLVRHQLQRDSGARYSRDEDNNHLMDPELTELYSRSRSQEEEIVILRRKIEDACTQELRLLKEKHVLERRLSDLRMALDEKQDDGITDTLKDLTHRKGYIEKNIRLAHELQVVEEEVYIFTSSLLSLLAEYNIRLPLLNASAISSNIKHLYQNMEWKIRSSDVNLDHEKHLLGNQPADVTPNSDRQPPKFSKNQLSQPRLDPTASSLHQHSHYPDHVESIPEQSRYIQNYGMMDMNGVKTAPSPDSHYRDFPLNTYNPHERHASPGSEGEVSLPGIEGFQIIGDAKPGNTLRACGFPTNGTSLCIFQWVRHLENGTRQSIEGATVPDYVVTADDVGTFLAVDCTPMDDGGRQGELVRLFANYQNKITCDPDMQHMIDTHISTGRAVFTVLLLMDSSEAWEPAHLILKRIGYQVKVIRTDHMVMEEKYSPDLSIKVPNGQSTQFVLMCSEGSILPFSTSGSSQAYNTDDIRFRDIIVLTLRNFQSKAVDGKRKGKA